MKKIKSIVNYKLILVFLLILVLTVSTYLICQNLPNFITLNNGPVIKINTLGTHTTKSSNWIESINISKSDDELLSLEIQEREAYFDINGKQKSILLKPLYKVRLIDGYLSQSSQLLKCPISENWSVSVSDEDKTVIFENDQKRIIYKETPGSSGVTEELK